MMWLDALAKYLTGIILVLAVGLVMCGCTTYWQKPGASDAAFARDDYQCMLAAEGLPRTPQSALTAPSGPMAGYGVAANSSNAAMYNLLDVAMSRKMYDRCMVANGWTKE